MIGGTRLGPAPANSRALEPAGRKPKRRGGRDRARAGAVHRPASTYSAAGFEPSGSLIRGLGVALLWLCGGFGTAAVHAQGNPFGVAAELHREPGGGRVLAVAFSIPEGHYLYASQIKVELAGDARIEPRDVPEPKRKLDPFSGDMAAVYDRDVTLRYSLSGAIVEPLAVTVAYQGCSSTLCFMPETETFRLGNPAAAAAAGATIRPAAEARSPANWRPAATSFMIVARASGYLSTPAFLSFLDEAETGAGGNGEGALGQVVRDRGVLALLVIVLLGGLALNLTPCVLPMIPINIAIIGAGAQASSRGRGFLLGTVYGAGIATVYGALGLVVVLTGTTFGTLNSMPWFNFAIAVVFSVLALAMFDVFMIDLSRFQTRFGNSGAGQGSRFLAAFFLGGVAALLAGACVAPVVISVLLLAAELYGAGNFAALLLPFVLGIGMALPWPFAGAGLSFLPKPGPWMTRVKHAFGVLILLFAAWYAYTGIALLRQRSRADGTAVVAAQPEQAESGWTASLTEGLARAQRTGQPVLVDFWASWCKNCLHMDKTTFRDPDVQARLDAYVKVKYQAENLRDPETKAVLEYFGVLGLPTYVVLKPQA